MHSEIGPWFPIVGDTLAALDGVKGDTEAVFLDTEGHTFAARLLGERPEFGSRNVVELYSLANMATEFEIPETEFILSIGLDDVTQLCERAQIVVDNALWAIKALSNFYDARPSEVVECLDGLMHCQ